MGTDETCFHAECARGRVHRFAELVGCVRTDKTVRNMVEKINAEKMGFPEYDKGSKGKEMQIFTGEI